MELGHGQPLSQNPRLLRFGDMEGSVQGDNPQQIKVRKRGRVSSPAPSGPVGRSAGVSESPLKDLNLGRNGLGLRKEAG